MSKTTRIRRATKKKLLQAIYDDFFNHVESTEIFIIDAIESHEQRIKNKIDFPATKLPTFSFEADHPSGIYQTGKMFYIPKKNLKTTCRDVLNYQLCLYFVWCFEKFEQFLSQIYAYICFTKLADWEIAHNYQNAPGDFLSTLVLAKRHKDYSKTIPKLQETFRFIADKEESGLKDYQHLKWHIYFFAKMRNHIVHCATDIEDMAKFREDITKKVGCTNCRNFKTFLDRMTARYVKSAEKFFPAKVWLLSNDPHENTATKCGSTNHVFLAYASLVKTAIEKTFFGDI